MKKIPLILALTILAGCSSTHSQKKTSLTENFSSNIHLPQSSSYTVGLSDKTSTVRLLSISPDAFNKVKGTYQAYRPKITMLYSIEPRDYEHYEFIYSGKIDYLSTVNITNLNGKQNIDGNIDKSSEIESRRITGVYGRTEHVSLPDGIIYTFKVDNLN